MMPAPVQLPEVVAHRIDMAMQMLDLGAWVFPLAHDSKQPWLPKSKGGEGFKDAKPGPEMARTFLSNAGQLNYGVVFPEGSDVIVLDLDGGDGKGPDWKAEWQALYDQHGPPGLTYIVRTPSGGRHVYYRWRTDLYGPIPPGDEMLGWTVRKPWKGYLVGPGSVIGAESYEPVGLELIADLAEPWARAAIAEKAAKDVITVSASSPGQVVVGHRHNYLRDQARHLVGVGLTGEALFTAVMDLNRQLADSKTEDEVRRAIGDAETKFQRDPVTGRQSLSDHARGGLDRQTPTVIEGLVFHTAAGIAAMTPEEVDWAWRGYVAHGAITEIVGPPKLGKTTIVLGLVHAYVNQRHFLGRWTSGGPVVVLSEQGPASLRGALTRMRLDDRDDVHILLYRDTRGHDWPDVIASTLGRCSEVGARLLVVDTLPAFAGLAGEDENSAGHALEAMDPLMTAAAEGMAVLVNRHRSKGPARDIADEGRGSGAFSGAVDVILSLRRKEGGGRPTIREIHAASRFDDTPEKLVIELEEGEYVSLGDDSAVESSEARTGVLDALGDSTGLTETELVQTTGKSRQTVRRVLADLMRTGDVDRSGPGNAHHPYRFSAGEGGPGGLSVQTPPPTGERGSVQTTPGGMTSIACVDHQAHRFSHRFTPSGWICDICQPEESA